MLKWLGKTVEKRPWLVIGIVLLITFGFISLLPALQMETSTEDFMPDNKIVNANQRVTEYFGQSSEMLMIFVDKQNAQNVITPQALKEEYKALKDLEDFDEVESSISVAGFIDMICQFEFGSSLLNCSDEQIKIAYDDMMSNIDSNEIKMMKTDDPNEKIDFIPNSIFSKGKNIDSLDLKNYYIDSTNQTFIFSIEVYDVSAFKEKISSPHRKINTWEWYINFENLIVPDEKLAGMNYQIAAHVEPSEPIWEIGNRIIGNLKSILKNIRNHQLFNSYKSEVYLWIKVPGQDISFPIVLESGNVTFNYNENRIEMKVDRKELGKYGIAPTFGGMELPAKIGNSKAGLRIYQSPILKQSWKRVSININFIQKLVEVIQNRPLINSISTRILNNFGDFSWEDFNELFDMLNSGEFAKESLSLKDIASRWVILDEASNSDGSDNILFIKPLFFEDLKSSSIMFLSKDLDENSGPSKTLMMIQLNITTDEMRFENMGGELGVISDKIKQTLIELDNKKSYVSMKITGEAIISNEMDEATMDANIIIMPGIFVVICLILLIMFKKFSYVILPLASLGISVIWLFGTMILLGISFNMMMVAIVPLLMGLGVDYSVHLFHNYKAELKNGKKPGLAIIASIQDVGMAIFLATLTTVVAFLSFLSAGIPPLRDFGILCALGIIYTLITALTFQMAVRFLLDRKKIKGLVSKNNNKISLDFYMEKFSKFILKQRKIILIFAVFITLILAIGIPQVKTTFDMNDFLPEGNEALKLMIDIGKSFPSASESQEYILIEGDVASVETLKGISKTYENLKDDEFVTKTPFGEPKENSILSIIRNAIRDNSSLSVIYNIDSSGIPKSDFDVVGIYDYLYNSEKYMMDTRSVLHLQGNNYDATVMRIYTDSSYSDKDSDNSNTQSETLYENLNNDLVSYGDANAIVTGISSSIYTIMNSMTESQLISTLISVLLAALILMIVFRNPLLGLITIIPVGISIIWIIGSIYFIGYSFNIMTVMVTSLNIGIGIAFGIHVTQRFRLTADRTGDVKKAVSKTIEHTGGALFIAALTTAAGFGMLILAPLPPEQQFGIITAMTVIYSYITSIFILPAVLMKWGEWRKQKKGFIISPNKIIEDY